MMKSYAFCVLRSKFWVQCGVEVVNAGKLLGLVQEP